MASDFPEKSKREMIEESDRKQSIKHGSKQTGRLRHLSFLFLFIFSLYSAFLPVSDASAVGVGGNLGGGGSGCSPTGSGILYCETVRACMPGQFIAPLIACFASTSPSGQVTPNGTPIPQGLIPAATVKFMDATKSFYLPGIQAMAILLVALYGVKLMLGDIQRVKGESFTLFFKIAGVFYFIDQAPTFYGNILDMMTEVNGYVSQAINFSGPKGLICDKGDLWQSLDCVFGFMLLAAGASLVAGLVAVVFLIIITCGTGIVIVFAFLYFIFTFFLAVARFFQIYFMSVVAFSFMFALGYLFVPLLLFKSTFTYFQKWMQICIAYILTPLVMYGFMAMVFITMDYSIISGPHSIMGALFGDSSPDKFSQMNCPGGDFCRVKFKNFFYLGLENTIDNGPQEFGVLGSDVKLVPFPGGVYEKQSHPHMMNFGLDYAVIDIPTMADRVHKTADQYLLDVALSFLVTALLAYIMLALMSYIPNVAGALIGQGTQAGTQVANAQVFGVAAVMYTLELAKEAAMAFATGGASLKETVARKGIETGKEMATGEDNKGEGGGGSNSGGGIPTADSGDGKGKEGGGGSNSGGGTPTANGGDGKG